MTIKEKALTIISNYASLLSKNNFIVHDIITKLYNYELVVTDDSSKLKLLVYFGKKGVKTVLQGNTETKIYIKVSSIIGYEKNPVLVKTEIKEPDNYIGSDESGKGDFFGPLVVSAVYTNKPTLNSLKKIGVDDSKVFNDNQIASLAEEIKTILGERFCVFSCEPKEYNDLYQKFKNLNKLLDWAHSKVIEELLNNFEVTEVITDKFFNSSLSISKKSNFKNVNFHQFTKGERYTAVAAASILARDEFNLWFEKPEQFDLFLPKGASSIVEKKAKTLFAECGENIFRNVSKVHFKTFERIKMK